MSANPIEQPSVSTKIPFDSRTHPPTSNPTTANVGGNRLLEVEKKYYADGEDAYSMKRDLTDLLNARDKERDQRAALHKAKRMKEGKPTNEIAVLEKKVKELKVDK